MTEQKHEEIRLSADFHNCITDDMGDLWVSIDPSSNIRIENCCITNKNGVLVIDGNAPQALPIPPGDSDD